MDAKEIRVFVQTTDGKFHRVWPNMWWDTSGTDVFDDAHVVKHIDDNPGVGLVVLQPH